MAFFMFYKEGKMKNLSVRNIVLAGFFLAVGIVFYDADTKYRQHVVTNAYPSIDLWVCLRVAVRINCWLYLTIA